MRVWPALLLIAVALGASALFGACGQRHGEAAGTPASEDADADAAGSGAAVLGRVPGVVYDEHGDPEGIHRYRKWSENVGQGGQPVGEIAFENLAALGYRTLLSVDGALPQVELAAKHGLRYVHVPIGYDGISKAHALKIVKAARLPHPIFVHCHHGKHRGPAAAMICRVVEDGISSAEAVKGLELSETSPNYAGLWRDVKAFVAPTAAELATVGKLSSRVKPEGVRAGMVDVSHRWEFLKLAKKAGWAKELKDHPDISPAHEARMLWELFREMARTDEESKARGDVYLAYLGASEKAAIALEKAIRAGDVDAANEHYAAVKNLCAECHRDYRN